VLARENSEAPTSLRRGRRSPREQSDLHLGYSGAALSLVELHPSPTWLEEKMQ